MNRVKTELRNRLSVSSLDALLFPASIIFHKSKYNFLQCIGTIDSSHIPIVAPSDFPASIIFHKSKYNFLQCICTINSSHIPIIAPSEFPADHLQIFFEPC